MYSVYTVVFFSCDGRVTVSFIYKGPSHFGGRPSHFGGDRHTFPEVVAGNSAERNADGCRGNAGYLSPPAVVCRPTTLNVKASQQ